MITETPAYRREREYLIGYLIDENPQLRTRFPRETPSVLSKMLGLLDDETLLQLEADEIPIASVYDLLTKKQRDLRGPDFVEYDDTTPLPNNPYVDMAVEQISEKIRTNITRRSFRTSEKAVSSGNGYYRKGSEPGTI